MEIRPILSAMRRNKVGAVLIAVQMAITLAILCNALFIMRAADGSSKRPTGADEANVFVIGNQWVGNPPDLSARLQGDLAALRSMPGVVDAFATQLLSAERRRLDRRRQSASGSEDADGNGRPVFCRRARAAGIGPKIDCRAQFHVRLKLPTRPATPIRCSRPAASSSPRALAEKLFPECQCGRAVDLRRSPPRKNSHHRRGRQAAGALGRRRLGQQFHRQLGARALPPRDPALFLHRARQAGSVAGAHAGRAEETLRNQPLRE